MPSLYNIHTDISIYRCFILDHDKKVAKFQTVKKERQVNALFVCIPPALPVTGLLQAVCGCKVK